MFGNVSFSAAPYSALGGAVYAAVVSNTCAGSETTVASYNAAALISELTIATDIKATVNDIYNLSLNDTGTVSEAVAPSIQFGSVINEVTTGTDASTTQVDFVCSINETTQAYEYLYTTGVLICNIQEHASILGQLSGRLQWDVIDTYESSVWNTINASQPSGWQPVNTNSTYNWNNIKTQT